jgi:acetyl esterase/lipase
VIQEVAKTAEQLVVFQRTPNFATPMNNTRYSAEMQDSNATKFSQLRAAASPVSGADLGQIRPSVYAESPEELTSNLDAIWERGGLGMAFASYADIHYNPAANEVLAEYIRERIRLRVHDPAIAELLCPTDHPYGTKRPPLESDYYEVYNQPNVTLVDVKTNPIERLTENGLATTAAEYDLDVVILALGFDAFSGAQLALPMTGRDGVTLKERWGDGPLAYLGMTAHGFPNYFQFATGPSAASQHNTVPLIEHQVDFAAAAVEALRESGASTIEPTAEADATWKGLCDGLLPFTLLPLAKSTWYLGHNIPGKLPVAYVFYAGAPYYHALLAQTQYGGWGGFAFDGETREALPPLARLDPGAANFVGAMMMSGAKPLEEVDLDVMRAQVAAQGAMQIPGPDMLTRDLSDPRVRLYLPDGEESKPVLVFYHGGGFVAGNPDSVDPLCRALAEDLGAIVVSVDYRLAPEHPFPAAVDDSVAAVRWAVEHIAEFGGDPNRIAVVGESAGANLAAVAARRAADEGIDLAAQVLVYPVVDGDAITASKREFFHGPFLSVPAGDRFWKLYVGDQDVTPDAAPLRAATLSGVAPALVLTMEIDPLRDEGEAYADLLVESGVAVEHHRLEGLIHGSYTFSALIPRAREIHDLMVKFLGAEFAREETADVAGKDVYSVTQL